MLGLLVALACAANPAPPNRPNIVLILADDLGWGDLGCYGQEKIRTPRLDALAREGMRFTRVYSGSTVCGPSRCALMTGQHTGHCVVRGNRKGDTPLPTGEVTLAKMLQSQGYATACIGKWGLGQEETTGHPNRQGFDHFFGYLNHQHAHNYYPDYLFRNDARIELPNRQTMTVNVAETRVQYVPDLCREEALQFLDTPRPNPFFLYFATTLPHANNERNRFDQDGNEVPTLDPYANEDWPLPERKKAAMITRLDADVGAILDKLRERGLADNTLVLFSSDNGPHKEGSNDPDFFRSSGPYRGIKRSLTDGGIRVPTLARWPGIVPAGTTSESIWAFWDVLPTVAEILQLPVPPNRDGTSFLAALQGKPPAKPTPFYYWEFHENGFRQAVLMDGRWKGIRTGLAGELVLYDTQTDPGEMQNVAAKHPDEVRRITDYLRTARTESELFPIPGPRKPVAP
jgi:arylsulfatase A-like enzyme